MSVDLIGILDEGKLQVSDGLCRLEVDDDIDIAAIGFGHADGMVIERHE